MLHVFCGDAYAKYFEGNQEAVNGILRLIDDNRPEDLSLFHSLTCKNNVILD